MQRGVAGCSAMMPKLRTYIKIRDFTDIASVVCASLPRQQRSIMGRFLCGILPLQIEVGRFTKKGKKEKDEIAHRLCKICNSGEVEDEMHFMFTCTELQTARNDDLTTFLQSEEGLKDRPHFEQMQWLLKEENLKRTAAIMEHLFHERQDKLYVTVQ